MPGDDEGGRGVMRRAWIACTVLALVTGPAMFAGRPNPATAQGGGTLEVEVKHPGAAVVEKLKVNKDTQQCGTEAVQEKVVVGPNKGLGAVVVSLPETKGGGPAKKAEIDQKGCKFVPRVVAVQAGGELDVKNSDGILHNIHTYSSTNPSINKAQPKFKKVMTEKFEKPEVVKVTCDVHSWMLGWVAVLPTPYFGVTDESGVVKIDNVPAGKHKVEVWHEVFGKQSKEVDVKAGQTAKVAFEMKKS
jgi:plastocyanin